jgi:glycosyltransferase involved in cell wall biosynthesis
MKRKICFVSLGSLPLLTSNENLQYAGGAELKQVLIAKELVKQKYIISFIVHNEKNDVQTKNLDDIILVKTFSRFQNIPFFKKVRMLWKSLKEANSDIYIQATYPPGIVALYCLIHRKKYIKWLSSDQSVNLQDVTQRTTLITKISLYFDIKLAHLIIVQNEYQKEIMERRFRKKCVLLKSPITALDDAIDFERKKEKMLLWVGTIRSIKQPELFLDIAKNLPQYKFMMIGGSTNSELELYNKIQKKSKSLSNLSFLGFIPHNKIQNYYFQSTIFVNTSLVEGFPYTFVEAWNNSIPVISLNIDPDEIICKNKLGFHSKTFQQMILDIKCLLDNDNLRNGMVMNARKYIKENHDLKKITNQFTDILTTFEN